jgi:hypothetical protein
MAMPTCSEGGRQHSVTTEIAKGGPRSPESLAQGMFPRGILRNLGELTISATWNSGNADVKGDRRCPSTDGGAVLQPHSTEEGGELQGFSQESGHGTHWREGGSRCTYLAKGNMNEAPTSTHPVMCFQYREDAEKVMAVLPKRFAKYGLTLHPEKTRLVKFGRYAEEHAKRQGKKPAAFDFLGFTHICARSRRGKFTVHVKTMKKRLRRGLKAIAEWCRENRHAPVEEQQKTLNAKLRGHYQYYGRPTNYRSILQFFRRVVGIWRKWLNSRTRGKWLTWKIYNEILRRHPLLLPWITHAWNGEGSRA